MANKKVLIPVDGSPQSMAAVKYAGRIFTRDADVTLFHLHALRPETCLDFGGNFTPADLPFEEWRGLSTENIDGYFKEAARILKSQGFASRAVEIISANTKQGYARDILEKSRDDFDALVFGRFGFATLGAGVLGGVAAKLVESARHIPLVVVGGEPDRDKILIACDGSAASKKAVTCVGDLATKKVRRVLLATVVRPLNLPYLAPKKFFKQRLETNWVDENTRKIVPLLGNMRTRLIHRGFDADQITESIIREKTSRADGIIGEARGRQYETIVAGRKGLTATQDFAMGRVTRKLLSLCDDRAVWIV